MQTQITLDENLSDYITRISLREPRILRELREETAALPDHLMQVPPEQGQFLRLLITAIGARRTLEVGVFTGYSLLSAALALPPDGRVTALDTSEIGCELAMSYCRRAGVADKVDMRVGDAAETLARLVEEPGAAGGFDFVFIDANKDGYPTYFDHALTLLRTGGLVVVDNVLCHGAVLDDDGEDEEARAVRYFNDRVSGDDRVELSMLPVADGMTLAVKR